MDATDEPEPLFDRLVSHSDGAHECVVVSPRGEAWLTELAAQYRSLRAELRTPPDPSLFTGLGFGVQAIRQRLEQAVMPRRRPGNFDVVRSDLGELLLAHCSAVFYGATFGYRSIRDRELADLPGRGIDLIGVESPEDGGSRVTLVLGEAKVSTEGSSPPRVVDAAEDSLRHQHLQHVRDPQATARKVFSAAKQCTDSPTATMMMLAAVLLEDGLANQLRVVAASLLVRPAHCATDNDFGSFLTTPGDFAPADVRFLTVRLASDLDSTVAEFYRLATHGEGSDRDDSDA